jgi:hypothetical protein
MDEILDFIVDRSLPKPIKISQASHDRMSVEDLWSTIWLLKFVRRFCAMVD